MEKKFREIIIKLRKEKDLSQEQLAKELNVSKSTIAMWETGNRCPSAEMYDQIADFFNVDIDYLYGRTKIRQKNHFDNDGTQYIPADPDIRRIQRARDSMTEKEREKMMNLLKVSFEDYFGDDFIDEDND